MSLDDLAKIGFPSGIQTFGMQILGQNINLSYISAGVIIVGGAGVSYLLYSRLAKRQDVKVAPRDTTGQEDISLPLALTHEFGNYRLICQTVDPTASYFLNQIPVEFFKFNDRFYSLAAEHFTKKLKKFRSALVIGSGTGKLCFELAKTFKSVKGIDRSYSKVVTSYQLQNRTPQTIYHFPLEGSYRTARQTISIDDPLLLSAPRGSGKKFLIENIEFICVEPNRELSLGESFQVVFLPNSLDEVDDAEGLLGKLNLFVQEGGLLVIATDYSWARTTNQWTGFGDFPVTTSYAYLKLALEDHFEQIVDVYIPDVVGESLRSCRVRNCHVTIWLRNDKPGFCPFPRSFDDD